MAGFDDPIVMTLFIMWIFTTVWAIAMTVFFILLSMWTPAWSFVKAKMKKQPLIVARRRDRKIDMHRAEDYIEGLATSKKYKASYIIDPDSVYTEKKSGVAILPVNAEIGITLSDKILNMIDGMKRMGFQNIEEAEAHNMQWAKCSCGYEGIMDFETIIDEETQRPIPKIIDDLPILICPYRKEESDETEKKEKGN